MQLKLGIQETKHMERTELLQKNLGSIKRGTYWFGIASRVCYIFAIGTPLIQIGMMAKNWSMISGTALSVAVAGLAIACVRWVFLGYIFHLIHDAFEAVDGLIREIGEIV